jgi:hypothetical protein
MKFKQVHLVTGVLMCEVGCCERREGARMRDSASNVVLLCEVCGERTELGGPLSVWRSGSITVWCECGERLTLADRLDLRESNKAAVLVAAETPTTMLHP